MRRMLGFCLGLALSAVSAPAQTPGWVRDLNNNLANDAVSAVEVFSAETMVAGGSFRYDNARVPDVTWSTYKIPFEHTFGESTNVLRPFIEVDLGYFNLNQDTAVGTNTVGQLNVSSLTGTLGGGIRWKPLDWLTVSPGLAAAYSHVWQNFSRYVPPGNPLADALGDWEANAFTLLPAIEVALTRSWDRWDFTVNSHFTYLWVVGLHDTSSLIDIGSTSEIWKTGLKSTYHSDLRLFEMPVSFSGGFSVYELYGRLADANFVDHFYEARIGTGVQLPKPILGVQHLVLSGAYYFYSSFSGYSFGLSVDF
ncbi:MAG: hypothetical protein U1F98_11395 [Verrucomicrobiota bacterium]